MELVGSLILISKIVGFAVAIIFTAVLSFIGLPVSIVYLILATLHYWQYGLERFNGSDLIILTVLTVLSVFLDNIVLIVGLKKTDASKRGYIGAMIGAIAGIFTANLAGVLVMTTAGAIIGELIHGKTKEASVKSGMGAAFGLLFGSLLRAILSLVVAVYVLQRLLF
jgi:uncharacterized protein YqgC (DUF456 family)